MLVLSSTPEGFEESERSNRMTVVIAAGVMTEIPKSGLKSFVARLAKEHNVQIEGGT